MKFIMLRILFQPFLSLPFLASLVSATSYLPDGTLAPGAYRCNNATSGHSTCCEISSVCWSNGVCQKVSNGVTDWIRLGCTDPTWNDPACLHACMSITHNALGVRPCDGIGGANYCCDLTQRPRKLELLLCVGAALQRPCRDDRSYGVC
ncbi:hypothetical protein BDZ45DRAFT_196145 [Acephala macrosclerotiorum]|nr:hypothetical protein BDZ45DRAFT_196145 [Acephala macrosclerotiorum]